jgi:hypothetical protein
VLNHIYDESLAKLTGMTSCPGDRAEVRCTHLQFHVAESIKHLRQQDGLMRHGRGSTSGSTLSLFWAQVCVRIVRSAAVSPSARQAQRSTSAGHHGMGEQLRANTRALCACVLITARRRAHRIRTYSRNADPSKEQGCTHSLSLSEVPP